MDEKEVEARPLMGTIFLVVNILITNLLVLHESKLCTTPKLVTILLKYCVKCHVKGVIPVTKARLLVFIIRDL